MMKKNPRKAYSELLYGMCGVVLSIIQWRVIQSHPSHRFFAFAGLILILLITTVFLWSSARLFRAQIG